MDYQYERRYDHADQQAHADELHGAYHPDFYYPAADVWHEHWAIGSNGHPPPEFVGYEAAMQWKRALHRANRTTLIDTTWAGIVFGDGLDQFARTLRSLGIELRWDPERQSDGGGDVSTDDLTKLIRSFLTHVKANGLTRADVEERLRTGWSRFANRRTTRFLELFWPIHDEWNNRLRADNLVDFDDMLTQATDAVATGQYQSPYELVMVDEFQDVSQGRARLIQHLTAQPGRYLMAVGDDWQSINRFAGADISVMTRFGDWFGDGHTLQLTTTFRCPQSITDVAAGFVQRNPHQFRKAVKSAQQHHGDPVTIIHTTNVAQALNNYLNRLSAELTANRSSEPSDTTRPTVQILGRYQFDRTLMPPTVPSNLQVEFRTAHASKGLEADYVVIPNMLSGAHGFPSDIQDDPLLDLVMATPDTYPRAEERRLFYVALTRAKRRVVLITQTGRESSFITELIQDPNVLSINDEGNEVRRCPTCNIGTLVQRTGRYGPFLGCTRYPQCTGKANLP